VNIRAALYAALSAASPVTSKLSAYGGGPAIFTARPVPQDAARPYIALSMVSDADDSVLNAIRERRTFDVVCVLDFTGSMAAADSLASAVKTALRRQPLTIGGGHHVETRFLGSTEAPTDATLTGVLLSFEIRAQPGA